MPSKKIQKSIDIEAPKTKVWDVLVKDEYNQQWYAEFSAGTKAVTDWKEGSKVLFVDSSNSGLACTVTVNKPAEELIVEYTGIVNNGVEDTEGEMAKAVKGGKEVYKLSEQNGVTHLVAECDMDEQMYDSMAATWDKAMMKIKELATKN
jgi:uncharacterized protein YndB with AHSA1/START domain